MTADFPPFPGESSIPAAAPVDPATADQMIASSWRWAVVTLPTFFLALWAVPNAARVSARLARGDVAGADSAAKTVRVLGIVGLILLVLLFISGFISGFNEASTGY